MKKSLFIDFDEVIYRSTKRIVDMYNEDYRYYSDFSLIDYHDIKTYKFEELTLSKFDGTNSYFNQPRFFLEEYIYQGAYIYLLQLSDIYDIKIVSMGYSPNLRAKKDFVSKYFPFADFIGCNFKIYKDKSHVDMTGSIFIDDVSVNLETSNAAIKIQFLTDDLKRESSFDGIKAYTWEELMYCLI